MTTSPDRQRSAVQRCVDHLGLQLVAEAWDLGVSARATSPFERPALSSWLQRPYAYEAVVWSHVDRAVRSVEHMTELIDWSRRHGRTLAFGMPEDDVPLVVTPLAGDSVIRRCMELARDAQREVETISARLTSCHATLREAGRYAGGLVPFGYRKAPHPSGSGWGLALDPETAPLVRSLVSEVRAGRSLTALARELNDQGVPVPRDRHAQLQGRRTGGRRHGRDFDRFRWTSGTLSKVLRSPSLKGHRTHGGQTVRDASGAPVLIGQPLLSEAEFDALQAALQARSNGTRRPRRPTSALLIGVVHCRGCSGRMYFAARKDCPYGDYVCRATARGDVCPAPAGVRSDWLEQYTLDCYRRATGKEAPATREDLLRDGVRVTVAKGRRGGGAERNRGPETSRLTFTIEGPAPQMD
ncbi:recombinase family protein [Streptomyces cinerochromogenes]|uniref:recombinase family protein n=1 Tax=Streptomyces cinerochromogenes TaxID=66422 RepID=UPI0016708109|nr:recombinase family protein [Streptomyces cinerochromogenes]